MNEESCSLVYTGQILEGMSFERVHQNLAAIFKTDVEKIKKKFSEKRSVLKTNVDRISCIKMQKKLLEAGAICDIIDDAEKKDVEKKEAPQETSKPVASARPVQSDAAANPYAAPRADLRAAPTDPGGPVSPRKRPASRGASWIFQGISLFFKRPFAWMLVMLCFFLISLIQIVPVLGAIALAILSPVFLAGLIMGAKDLDEKNEFSIGCLFRGFQQGFGQLALLGLLFLGAMIIGVALMAGVMFLFIGSAVPETGPPSALFAVFPLFLALFLPVMMGYWFSPALIAIHGKPVFEAISLSFRGCLKNMLPFTVYSLVAMAATIGVFLVLGVLSGIAGASLGGIGPMVAIIPIILMLPLMLAIMPIYLSTIYTSYRDIFFQD